MKIDPAKLKGDVAKIKRNIDLTRHNMEAANEMIEGQKALQPRRNCGRRIRDGVKH